MRSKYILAILLAVLAINLISAVEIKLSKTSYQPQETLQAEITGNFIDTLTKDNILIYKSGVPRSQPVISDLTKQGDVYYFYAVLPNQEGNFSLKIENIRYTETGAEKTTAIVKEFEIKKTNESALQINPGFVKTSGDFSVKIKSLAGNQQVTTELGEESKNYSLIEGIEKTIQFTISSLAIGKNDLKIIYSSETTKGFFSSITTDKYYTIPVFIIEKIIINNTTINQTNQTNINQTNQTNNQTNQKINITNKTYDEIKAMHCDDFGTKCEDDEECDVEKKESLEGPCCPGTCIEKKGRSYTWIGVLLIIMVLLAIVFIYFKYKRKKPPTSEDILKTRTDKFDERMHNKEVSGKLDSV